MHVTIDLTPLPPYCVVGRNDLSEEPFWVLELWPDPTSTSEALAFLADSLDDLDRLSQAIRDAVDRRRQAAVPGGAP